MPRRLFHALGIALLLPTGALADVVASDCDWLGDVRNVVEPWEENSRTFYNGQLRVALADSIEPACCSLHVLLLLPAPEDPLGGRQCVAINQGGGSGFGEVRFNELQADYDPATGLVLTFPYARFDPELSRMGPLQKATVQVNLTTGQVRAR